MHNGAAATGTLGTKFGWDARSLQVCANAQLAPAAHTHLCPAPPSSTRFASSAMLQPFCGERAQGKSVLPCCSH